MTFNIKTLALVLALSGMFLPQVPVARAADAVWGSVPWACNTSQTVDYGCDMTAPTLMQSFNLGQSITITGWQSYNTVVQSLSDRCAVAFMIVSLAGDHTNDVGVSVTDTVYSLGIQTNIVPTWQHTATDGYFRVCSVNGTFTMPPVASLPAGIQAAIASGQQMYAGFYPIYYTNGPFVGGYNVGAVYKPIRIIDPNQAPTAYITSANPTYDPTGEYSSGNRTIQVPQGTSITLNGRGTDADGTVGVYEWRQSAACDSGGTVTNAQTKTIDTSSLALGSHKYYFAVIDNQSKRSVGCPYVNVVVTASQCKNVPVNAAACPNSVTDNINATLEATCANEARIKCLYRCSDGYLVSGSTCVADNWCGIANGAKLTTKPSVLLCKSDTTASAVNDTTNGWSWSCTKGTVTSSCAAVKKEGGNR